MFKLRKFSLFLVATVIMSLFAVPVYASSDSSRSVQQQKKMVNSAHRGASGHAPENTRAAFEKAFEMKADYIEIDVKMTKDKELVAIHDTTVNRTTNSIGAVGDYTLAELQKLIASSLFQYI